MEETITFATMLITTICGYIATKIPWINNKIIPLQNILIGLTISIIYYINTQDFSYSVTMAGIFSTGIYSIGDNIADMMNQKKAESAVIEN